MIITKLNIDDEIGQININIEDDLKPVDVLAMIKYLEQSKSDNCLYINWDKHLFGKKLEQVI